MTSGWATTQAPTRAPKPAAAIGSAPSARATAEANGVGVDIILGDAADSEEPALAGLGEFDLIVLNPPFHQGTTKDSSDTLAMFAEAARVLRPGGQLWCVYNSHLPYRKELNVAVGRTVVVAQDRSYTVALATRRG